MPQVLSRRGYRSRGYQPFRHAAATPIVSRGLLADYRFLEGSGTTTADSSGNGYTGTLGTSGSATPTWSSTGLVFNKRGHITSSAPFASIQSVVFFGTQTDAATSYLVGSDVATAPAWVVNNSGYPTPSANEAPLPAIWLSGPNTIAYNGVPANVPKIYTWTNNGTRDRIYINGNADTKTDYSGFGNGSGPTGRTGNLTIGEVPAISGGAGFKGTKHRLMLYSVELTAAEVAQNALALASFGASRGVPSLFVNPTTTRVLAAEGDSITLGFNVANPWPQNMTLAQSYTRCNFGHSGQSVIGQMDTVGPTKINPFFAPAAAKCVLTFMGSTNDIGSHTAAQIYAAVKGLLAVYLAAGWYVVWVPSPSYVIADAGINNYNNLIYANLATDLGNPARLSLVPAANLPHLVGLGLFSNTTYFQADGTHPNQTGDNELMTGVAPVIDAIG